MCGQTGSPASDDCQIAKYNAAGVLQWQRSLSGGASAQDALSISADTDGNTYICGQNNTVGGQDFLLAKYNSSGSLQWQNVFGDVANLSDKGTSVAVDASGVYACGQYFTPTEQSFQIVKFNAAGAVQWQRRLGQDGVSASVAYSISLDTSSNLYICGFLREDPFGSQIDFFQVAKYNSSGTIQWQRKFGPGGGQDAIAFGIAVDSSGNSYVAGQSNARGVQDCQLIKYNTSGTIQWQRNLYNASASVWNSVAVDGSGNVYACGQATITTSELIVAKYDSSGAIQWQRKLGGTGSETGLGITVRGDVLFVCGRSNGPGTLDFLFARLPTDGSLTGTYSVGGYSITYAVSTMTDASTSLSSSTITLTDQTTSGTVATSTLTDAASTLTSSVTTI
jgi:hypothetical protein